MAEPPNVADASMADAPPQPVEPSIQAPPVSVVAESEEDSRTAVVGRKRGFQEAADTHISDDEPRKRVKENSEHEREGSMTNVDSISPAPAQADEEADMSRLPSAHASVFNMLKDGSGQDQISVVQAPFDGSRPSTTWNTGVQSGLRTSFAAKGKAKFATRPVEEEDSIDIEASDREQTPDRVGKNKKDEYDVQDPFIGDSDAIMLADPQPESANLSNVTTSVPFRKLSKKQERELPKEERDAYRQAVMERLKEERQAKAAAKATQSLSSGGTDDSSKDLPHDGSEIQQLHDASDGDEFDDDEKDSDDGDEDGDMYDKAEFKTNQSRPNLTAQNLAAIGDPPTPPPRFHKLSKKAKRALPKEQKEQYDKDYTAHMQTWTNYQRAMKAYHKHMGKPPQILPPDVAKNPRKSTSIVEDKHERREKCHKEAKQILQKVKQWPLPANYHGTTVLIQSGDTYYPAPKTAALDYFCKRQKFLVREVLDGNGLPIAIQDMSFNIFVSEFMMWNRDNWGALDERNLKAAFNHYLSLFYQHIINLHPEVRATADATDALTLKIAKKQVKQKIALLGSVPAAATSLPTQIDPVPDNAAAISLPTDAELARQANKGCEIGEEIGQAIEKAPVLTAIDDPELREAFMFLQRKYYPSNSDAIRCLACTKIGHMNDTCPALNCKTCDTRRQHSTMMCPRGRLCEKCRERGHNRSECPERLAVPRSELVCELCGDRNHVESECSRIWRTFSPDPRDTIVVSGIPVYCFTCGGPDHYGPDCGLYRARHKVSVDYTFTKSNLFKYLDTQSRHRAISAGVDYSLPPRPKMNNNFSIKGKANDPITIDDSDEEDFIRPPIAAGNVTRGNINFGKGQHPQAPFRAGPSGQGQMSVQFRGGPRGNTGGKNASGPANEDGRPKRGKNRPEKKTRAERRAAMREGR